MLSYISITTQKIIIQKFIAPRWYQKTLQLCYGNKYDIKSYQEFNKTKQKKNKICNINDNIQNEKGKITQINIKPTYHSTQITKPDTFRIFSSNIELS